MKPGDIIAPMTDQSRTYLILKMGPTGSHYALTFRIRDGRILPGAHPLEIDLRDFDVVGKWESESGYEEGQHEG
jgi:hypothetical protein